MIHALTAETIFREELARIREANDCHNPAGTGGGQFCSHAGGSRLFFPPVAAFHRARQTAPRSTPRPPALIRSSPTPTQPPPRPAPGSITTWRPPKGTRRPHASVRGMIEEILGMAAKRAIAAYYG